MTGTAPRRKAIAGSSRHRAALATPVPADLERDLLARLWYVSEALAGCTLSPGRQAVDFTLRPGHEGDAQRVAADIAEVARTMSEGYRPVEMRIAVDHRDRRVPWNDDPHPVLADRGELFAAGRGRYAFGPSLTGLLEALDRATAELAQPLAAAPHRFPSLLSAEVLDRCRYLRSFPHALTFASHLREELGTIREFASTARVDGDGRLELAAGASAKPECLLAPTVCFHWYALLAGQRLDGPRAITASGKCFRYESENLSGLERLWDFTMREVVFVGSSDEVLAARDRALELTVEMLDRWELAYAIESANDPFFIEGFSMQRAFQSAFELKWEVAVPLPYKGASVAVGSLNYHQDFFGRALDITGPDGEPVHSACVGFGLERLALAVTAQFGPDPEGWPAPLRRALEAGR